MPFRLAFFHILCAALALAASPAWAADPAFQWPGKAKAAVSLAYDDALDSQLDNAIPSLDKFGLKGSFYLQLSNPSVARRMPAWRAAAAKGHELGNHTLFHQCAGSPPGREFVQPHRNLDTTTVAQMKDQVQLANTMLLAIDGRRERTFTAPCADLLAGGVPYLPAIAPEFVAMKVGAASGVVESMAALDPNAVPAQGPVGLSGAQLIAIVKAAGEKGTMVSLTFHGIGGDYLSTSNQAHEELLRFLAAHRDTYWTDTFVNIMQHVRRATPAPAADHHQHLFSPAIAAFQNSPVFGPGGLAAPEIVALLDQAGIGRAAVLSVAYMFGRPDRQPVADELAKVRAENDWTAAQAAQYPDRLRAFCGVNPLRDYALEELARCAAHPGLRHGVKLHFGNSDIQLDDPLHLEKMKQFFRAANGHRMAIAAHLRASISRKRPYGAAQARILLEQLLPLAPDIPVQIAHMAGTGPGFDDAPAHEVLGVLAGAAEQRDPRMRNVWFDVASVADPAISPANAALLVRRMRQIGLDRILYGTDAAVGDNLRPRESWYWFRRLPMSEVEFARIAANVAPYLR